MIIIYGSRLYGKVDVVPGLFHVETKFGHLWYIPLIPVESYVVFAKSGDGFNGVPIPMSFKSVFYAWLRTIALIATIVASIMVLVLWDLGPSKWATPAIIAASSLGTLIVLAFHRGSTHASYHRACQIGELIGLTEEGRMAIDHIFTPPEDPADPFFQDRAES